MHSYHDNVSGTLELENIHDLVLHSVYITESSVYGLVGFNLLGTTKVRYCHLYNNGSPNGHQGGNALVHFTNSSYDKFNQHCMDLSHSHFTAGNNSEGSGGLGIFLYEENSNISIHISYCSFNGNKGNRGAGLHIAVDSGTKAVIRIEKCNFYNSVSREEGGSSFIKLNQGALVDVHFCYSKFIGNSGWIGGAIYMHFEHTYYVTANAVHVKFTHCTFSDNKAGKHGGAIYGNSVSWSAFQCVFQNNTANGNGGHVMFDHHLSLSNCWFESGSAKGRGGGVYHYSMPSSRLSITSTTFVHNTTIKGGGLAHTNLINDGSSLNITNCNFTENQALYGGGVYIALENFGLEYRSSSFRILITNSQFLRNSANSGGGFEASLKTRSYMTLPIDSQIILNGTRFISNAAIKEGSAINITGCTLGTIERHFCQGLSAITFTIVNGLFSHNVVHPLSYNASTISLYNMESFYIISSQMLSNKGSAIHARESQISFEGDVVIANNIAFVGGALHLDCYHSHPIDLETTAPSSGVPDTTCSRNLMSRQYQSVLILGRNSSTLITNNTALQFGGAIALNEQCNEQTYDQIKKCRVWCFFNVPAYNSTIAEHIPTVHMQGNKAMIAGNVFYGGPLEACTFIQNPHLDSIQMFRSYFVIKDQNVVSTIDVVSDPIRICFCKQNITEGPYCTTEIVRRVYRGQEFNVSVIAVAPLSDASSMFVKAQLPDSQGQLGWLQKAQEVNRSCEKLTYSVRAAEEHAELLLTFIRYPQSQTSLIHVRFLDCPFGFELTGEPPKCDCAKHLTSAVPQITCDINSYALHLPDSAWVGNFSEGIVAHPNCPHDYCNASNRLVGLDNQDVQCSHKHSGVLCGSCQPGLSLALGSSHCLQCSNIYLLLLLPFAVAGLLLVAVLQKCDLNVSKGTINGLIFYANIVQVNKSIFFPQNYQLWVTNVLATFVAWINLDLGIETCFCNKLNAIAQVWLQFAFPAYVWIIVGAMIYASRYSVTASKLTGSNAVPVLATLFLLSYTKLLRAVIAAVSPIAITDQNAISHLLWATDGNVPFLHGAHIPLFLMAVLMTSVYIVPLTTVVTLAPYLQARSQHKLLRWVVRIKPLLDAYTGPYTDKHRYWTGFMLLTRITIFIAFAANSTGDPKLNLLVINGVVAGVLVIQRWAGKLYKSFISRFLEVLYLLNLLFLSAITLFLKGHRSAALAQEITLCTMVGVSFLLFIFTLCWHMYNYTTISGHLRQKLASVFPKFTRQYPQSHSAEDTVGGAGAAPVQETQAQPTVSVIDMSELREPLLTNN